MAEWVRVCDLVLAEGSRLAILAVGSGEGRSMFALASILLPLLQRSSHLLEQVGLECVDVGKRLGDG